MSDIKGRSGIMFSVDVLGGGSSPGRELRERESAQAREREGELESVANQHRFNNTTMTGGHPDVHAHCKSCWNSPDEQLWFGSTVRVSMWTDLLARNKLVPSMIEDRTFNEGVWCLISCPASSISSYYSVVANFDMYILQVAYLFSAWLVYIPLRANVDFFQFHACCTICMFCLWSIIESAKMGREGVRLGSSHHSSSSSKKGERQLR